jgi:hypothetical protein
VLDSGKDGLLLSTFSVDANDLFYFLDRTLYALPRAGGSRQVVRSLGGLTLALDWGMDSTSLYLVDRTDDTLGANSGVFQVPKSGGAAKLLFTETGQGVQDDVIGADDSSVYITQFTLDLASSAPAMPEYLSRLDKAGGGSPTHLATLDPSETIFQATVQSGIIAYSTITDLLKPPLVSRLYALPTAGGTPVKLFEGSTASPFFTVAGGFAYFENGLQIEKVPLAGGTPTALPGGITQGVYQFAADTTNLYWAESPGCLFKTPL